uniref:GRF-type domain-containing protein n=1 Tax=Chenopodium quinoa TaxID=63459 RepID=A0A803MGB0_CHEQI
MSSRRQSSNAPGLSSNSRRDTHPKIRCKCEKDVVVRIVIQGPNLGCNIYGCPLWPDTHCDLFKWFNDNNEVEDCQMKMLEKDTIILELEYEQKI